MIDFKNEGVLYFYSIQSWQLYRRHDNFRLSLQIQICVPNSFVYAKINENRRRKVCDTREYYRNNGRLAASEMKPIK